MSDKGLAEPVCRRPGDPDHPVSDKPVSSGPCCILTVDVEDWFHSENLPITQKDWDKQKPRVREATWRLLALLEEYNLKGSFFILGWVARRYPDLVMDILHEGHEIACHGFNHQLVYKMSRKEFREDVKRAKALLEDITSEEVIGYRASNFSITDWAIGILQEEGFIYDSSLCQVSFHDRYGKFNHYQVALNDDLVEIEPGFWEITIPTLNICGLSLPWGGGGYFRLLPYPIFKTGLQRILKEKQSFVFYIHPREIDPGQPHIADLAWVNRFRHRVGLKHCEAKLRRLLSDFRFIPVKERLIH